MVISKFESGYSKLQNKKTWTFCWITKRDYRGIYKNKQKNKLENTSESSLNEKHNNINLGEDNNINIGKGKD